MYMPDYIAAVLARLEQAGFQAFIVGGCVRDSLMGREPSDWDVTTSAHPEQVMAVFAHQRVVGTGLRHGTVTVTEGGESCEITSFRVDGAYSDGRRPDSVSFTANLEEDLARRDFTINAMAWNPSRGLRDPFGGAADITARRIACVGDPAARFREDGLRILRAVRFASVLDFQVEDSTARAMEEEAGRLRLVAAERVRVELDKALAGPGLVRAFGGYLPVLAAALPELADPSVQSSWPQIVEAVGRADTAPPLRLTVLWYGIVAVGEGNPVERSHRVAAALTRLRYPTDTVRQVERLTRWLHQLPEATMPALLRRLNLLGEGDLRLLLAARLALFPEDSGHISALEALLAQALAENRCYRLQDLAVKGDDLRHIGIPPGREMGRVLSSLLDSVMDGALPNTREALLAAADGLGAQGESATRPSLGGAPPHTPPPFFRKKAGPKN